MNRHQRNYTIDIFRAIGALCVVILHSPLGSLPNVLALSLRLGSRWAVPFFFLVSGYLVVRNKVEGREISVAKSVNNLIAIFIISNLVYLLFFLLDNNPATPAGLTFTGLLIGQQGHLWFIGSSIFGLILLQYVTSRYSDVTTLVIAGVTLLIIIGSEGYAKVLGLTMQNEIARYFTSIPFLFAGYLIARHNSQLPRLSAQACLIWVVLGLGLEFGEALLLYWKVGSSPHNQELLLGTAVAALGLFYFSLMVPIVIENQLSRIGKTYSLLIYLYHPLLALMLFDKLALGSYSPWLYWISPLVVFTILLLLLKIIHRSMPKTFAILSGR